MPGRIVGRTNDLDGKQGFVLTLQAREQHIRRAKATSNICTNQGLLVTASTIYMSLLGPDGLREVAKASHQNMTLLKQKLEAIAGVECVFKNTSFHEFVLRLPKPAETVLNALADKKIQGGFNLSHVYPELGGHTVLVCVTETKTEKDMERFASELEEVLTGSAETKKKVASLSV